MHTLTEGFANTQTGCAMDTISPTTLQLQCQGLSSSEIISCCEDHLQTATRQKEEKEDKWTCTASAVAEYVEGLIRQDQLDETSLQGWNQLVQEHYGGEIGLKGVRNAANSLQERCEASSKEILENWGVWYDLVLEPEWIAQKRPSKHLLAALARFSACCPYKKAQMALKKEIEARAALPAHLSRGRSRKKVLTVADVLAAYRVHTEISLQGSHSSSLRAEDKDPKSDRSNSESMKTDANASSLVHNDTVRYANIASRKRRRKGPRDGTYVDSTGNKRLCRIVRDNEIDQGAMENQQYHLRGDDADDVDNERSIELPRERFPDLPDMDLDSYPFSQHSDIEEGFENSSVLGDDLNDCLTKSNMTAGIEWPSSPATETLDSSIARRFDLNGILTENIEVPSLNNIPSLDSSSSTESPRQGQPVPPTIIQRSQIRSQDHTSSLESVRENSVMDELLPSTDRLGASDTLQPGQWLSATAIELVLSHWHYQEDFRLVDSSYLDVNHPEEILKKPPLRLMGALRLLLPLNHGNHWTLLLFDFDQRTVHHYDSLAAASSCADARRAAFYVVEHLGEDKESFAFTSDSVYRQENGYDCGVCVLVMALHLLVNMRIPTTYDCSLWRVIFIALLRGEEPVESLKAYTTALETLTIDDLQASVKNKSQFQNMDVENLRTKCNTHQARCMDAKYARDDAEATVTLLDALMKGCYEHEAILRTRRTEMQTELSAINGFVDQYATFKYGQTASTMRALESNQITAQSAVDRVDRRIHMLEEGNNGRDLALRTGKEIHMHHLTYYEKLRVAGRDASRALHELVQKQRAIIDEMEDIQRRWTVSLEA